MTALNRRQLLRYGASTLALASAATVLPRFVSAAEGDDTSSEPGVGGGDVEVDLTIQDVDYELIDGSTVFMYAFSLNGAAPRIPGPPLRVREGRNLAIYQFCRKAVDVRSRFVIQGFRPWRTLETPHEWHHGNCGQHQFGTQASAAEPA